MSIISEKVSYLCGLAEGLKIEEKTDEGKLLKEIISVLGEIADEMEFMDENVDELSDKVYDLEDEVYGEDDCDCCDCDDDDEEPFVVNCPNCNEDFFVYVEDLESDEAISCPNCGQEVELEFDECDCGDCE